MKIPRDTQDSLQRFQGALDDLYWKQFFHLEQDERPDAIQSMVDRNILTTKKDGHYEVNIRIKGISDPARNFEYGPDRQPLYFRDEAAAKTLVKFCENKGGSTLIEHDRQEQ